MRTKEADSLEKITNTRTNKILQERFGDDFWSNFHNELDTLSEN